MPAQRSQSSQTQNPQSRSSYNSGMERLKSQNLLFNSGESRNFRERESSRDRNYDSRQNQREREVFHPVDHFIAIPRRIERIATAMTEIIAQITTGIEVRGEKEISDSLDSDLLHLCTQTGSDIILRSEIIM
jgi:hypothetical protein